MSLSCSNLRPIRRRVREPDVGTQIPWQDKQESFQRMSDVSDICMVTMGACILGLLLGDFVQMYRDYQVIYPIAKFLHDVASSSQ